MTHILSLIKVGQQAGYQENELKQAPQTADLSAAGRGGCSVAPVSLGRQADKTGWGSSQVPWCAIQWTVQAWPLPLLNHRRRSLFSLVTPENPASGTAINTSSLFFAGGDFWYCLCSCCEVGLFCFYIHQSLTSASSVVLHIICPFLDKIWTDCLLNQVPYPRSW